MTTIVFPGQGSQYIEMTKDFYQKYHVARQTFELISETTKINIKQIIFENPKNLLQQTQYTQLAIFSASISIYNVLKNETNFNNENINYMLGHSLGEYTALAAADFLSIEDCAKLLKIRGELMQNAYPTNKSGMAAIIGLNCNTVEEIINKNYLKLEIANDNSPMQIVISGEISELNNSEKYFKNARAKRFLLLNVSAAFHSKIMIDAQNKMKNFITNTNFKQSNISIISNYDASISKDINTLSKNLSKQMSNRVRWVESIKNLENANENSIIEIGPGKILSGLIKRISNNFDIKNIEYIADIEK